MIHPCVRDAFYDFNKPLEGVVPWMYLDVRGLVTVGVGCLIDPEPLAEGLPWVWKGWKTAAPPDAVAKEWARVKANTELARLGARAAEHGAQLVLTEDGIRTLVGRRLDANIADLSKGFDFATWPADAQLGVLSMAWAMGSGFSFPRFEGAANRLDFDAAAEECKMREEGNPGLVKRNALNRALFHQAAMVLSTGGALERFWGDQVHDDPKPIDTGELDSLYTETTDVDP